MDKKSTQSTCIKPVEVLTLSFMKLSDDAGLIKALGKLGNIVAETLCFLSMFPCLPTSGNIVAETKCAPQEVKMFPNKFRNIFVAETMFPSLPTCYRMFPARETLFSRLGMLEQCFKTVVQT